MGWFRGNRTIGGWLALFGLAVQLAVSFGHVHPLKAASGSAGVAIAKVISGDGDQDRHAGKGSPASDAFCDICATLALTGSAQISVPPALALPASVAVPVARVANMQAPVQRRYVLSQSRAPPAV